MVKDGLKEAYTHTHTLWSSKGYILKGIETVADERISVYLGATISPHYSHAGNFASNYAMADQHNGRCLA